MATTRIERDSFGTIDVPADQLGGAQMRRSRATDMDSNRRGRPGEMLRPGAKRRSPD
jgi:fumarate hydratase class II